MPRPQKPPFVAFFPGYRAWYGTIDISMYGTSKDQSYVGIWISFLGNGSSKIEFN